MGGHPPGAPAFYTIGTSCWQGDIRRRCGVVNDVRPGHTPGCAILLLSEVANFYKIIIRCEGIGIGICRSGFVRVRRSGFFIFLRISILECRARAGPSRHGRRVGATCFAVKRRSELLKVKMLQPGWLSGLLTGWKKPATAIARRRILKLLIYKLIIIDTKQPGGKIYVHSRPCRQCGNVCV